MYEAVHWKHTSKVGWLDPNSWNPFHFHIYFQSFVKCSKEDSVLLLMDNHFSHFDYQDVNFAKKLCLGHTRRPLLRVKQRGFTEIHEKELYIKIFFLTIGHVQLRKPTFIWHASAIQQKYKRRTFLRSQKWLK